MQYFKEKSVLITGSADGIGKQMALHLLPHVKKLHLVDLNGEKLQELKSQNPSKIETHQFDISHWDNWNILRSLDCDIIIANAGLGGLNPAYAFDREVHERTFNVNVRGLVYTFQSLLPKMIKKQSGHLVAISSLASMRGLPNAACYSASKAAVNNIMDSYRMDLRSAGISVTTVMPGFIQTRMTDHQEFDTPFNQPVDVAAMKILKAVAKKNNTYAFPWPVFLLSLLNRFLPTFMHMRIVPLIAKAKSPDRKAQIF